MNSLIKTLILTLFATIISIVPTFAKEYCFLQVSDVHFQNVPYKTANLTKAVNNINKMNDVDFVVFSGDITDKFNQSDLRAFYKIANNLNKPYYVVLGNHDVFKAQSISKETHLDITTKYSHAKVFKSQNYSFVHKNTAFIVLDGSKDVIPGAAGYFSPKTLAFLDKRLSENKRKNVVIIQHFPLVESRLKNHNTYNRPEYYAILEKHKNVKAIVAGHYHEYREEVINDVFNIVAEDFKEHHTALLIHVKDNGLKDFEIYSQLIDLLN